MSWFSGKRIVVPFDFSDECVRAAKTAMQLAIHPDEVHIAHVLMQLPATDPAAVWDELNEENRKATMHESIVTKLADNDIQGVQINVLIGNPGRMIADLAAEIEAGLIVVPSHGYKGIRRWLLGSVAERIVQLAKCPVLVLKTQEEEGGD